MENEEINALMTILLLPASFIGLILLIIGMNNRNNTYRAFVLVWAFLVATLYAIQTVVAEQPMNALGFPLLGIVCWGIISGFQVAHMRMNTRSKRLDEEYEQYKRQANGDSGV